MHTSEETDEFARCSLGEIATSSTSVEDSECCPEIGTIPAKTCRESPFDAKRRKITASRLSLALAFLQTSVFSYCCHAIKRC